MCVAIDASFVDRNVDRDRLRSTGGKSDPMEDLGGFSHGNLTGGGKRQNERQTDLRSSLSLSERSADLAQLGLVEREREYVAISKGG